MASAGRWANDLDGGIKERMEAATVWALPARWYADPDIYRIERRRIFSRHWLWIGREDEVAEPGQYITAAPAEFPLFVRRSEEGALHGFHNVCRHRASKLLTEPSGQCAAIECPYHGWRYRSDGTLDHVPLFGEAPDFPKD
ncbi:MAG: Rieske (2Fe-2S) protein, partial [Rhodospirillaceae bacterium]|nr:Rieske (2Fe-2S) protein [Rhodospirillaceae bacterium]